jgi:hypothetical protein
MGRTAAGLDAGPRAEPRQHGGARRAREASEALVERVIERAPIALDARPHERLRSDRRLERRRQRVRGEHDALELVPPELAAVGERTGRDEQGRRHVVGVQRGKRRRLEVGVAVVEGDDRARGPAVVRHASSRSPLEVRARRRGHSASCSRVRRRDAE